MAVANQIGLNLARIRDQVAAAAKRSGRPEDEIQMVAVTKYASIDVTRQLVEAGCSVLGESRPQQLWEKADALSELNVHWHMIGHLQRNKLRRTLPAVHLLHSIDSSRLLDAVHAWAVNAQQTVRILIEVNVSGDAEKHGFQPPEAAEALRKTVDMDFVDLRGLMGMASRKGDESIARRNFRDLRQLRDRWMKEIPNCPDLQELSMGMSRDFPIAIEEGATLIRVGSTLFDGIDLST